MSGCDGPGDRSCLDYIQLTSEVVTLKVNGELHSWQKDDPHLQGRDLVSSSYSFTGWYFESTSYSISNLFRSRIGSSGLGGRLLTIHRIDASFAFLSDGTLGVNDIRYMSLSAPVTGKWYFVGMSECSNQVTCCYAFIQDADVTCLQWPLQGSMVTFATTASSTLFVGDASYGGITGEILDQRYYWGECRTIAQFSSLYTQRKALSLSHCAVTASPFVCSTCDAGCSLTNGYCLSTHYVGRSDECAVLDTDAWRCVTCAAGYSTQPQNSHLCFPTCPSGYSSVSGVCVGSDQVIADFTFDVITPTVSGGAALTAVNGATLAYYPPAFEASDPIPCKHRGYYFSGTQYLQLPPASLATGTPLLLPTSLTISMWLRPQGSGAIYCKREGSNDILSVRISASNLLEFSGGFPQVSYAHPSAVPHDVWMFAVIAFQYSSTTGQTTVSFFFNGVKDSTAYSSQFYIRDYSLTAPQFIGAATDLSDFYFGFLWRITVRNYALNLIPSVITSPACPAGLSFCLSPCPFLKTPECEACQTLCSSGCVRTSDCGLCADLLCLSCSGFRGEECTACVANAGLETAGSSLQCGCSSGYYRNAASCDPCHFLCGECTGGAASECVSCKDFAQLAGDPPSSCSCEASAYPSPDASNCKLCHHSCLSCSGSGPQQCSSCRAGALLKENSCQCATGFYLSLDGCLACPILCEQCASDLQCVACKANSSLVEDSCACQLGFFLSATECLPCSESCSVCQGIVCTECRFPTVLFHFSCLARCPAGYAANTLFECIEVSRTPPIPSLTVLPDNSLLLGFDHPMNCSLTKSDITVDVICENGVTIPVSWSDPVFTDPQTAVVALQFESQPGHCTVNLSLIFPEKLTDDNGVAVEVTQLVAMVNAETSSNPSLLTSPVAVQMQAAAKGAVTAVVSMSFFSGSPWSLISSLNQFQLITYIPMSKLELPSRFRDVLAALNAGKLIPNPVAGLLYVNYTSQQTEDYMTAYGVESALLLPNLSSFAGVSLAILISYLPIWLLSRSGLEPISTYFLSLLPSFRWGVPMSIGFVLYLDSTLYSLIQLLHKSIATAYLSVNTVLAFVLFSAVLLAPGLLVLFQHRNIQLLTHRTNQEFNTRWKVLIEPFSTDGQCLGVTYYLLFLLRRLALALAILLLAEYPKCFLLTNIGFSLLTLQLLLIRKPFLLKFDQAEAVIVESGTTLVYLEAGLMTIDCGTDCIAWLEDCGLWTVRSLLGLSIIIPVLKMSVLVARTVKSYTVVRHRINKTRRVANRGSQLVHSE